MNQNRMMRSLEILCLVLVGFAVVQAQVEEAAVTDTTESTQSEPSTTSVYDRLAERMKKLGDRSEARVKGVAVKMNEASAKVQDSISELNAQTAASGQEIMGEARNGASNFYDGASGVVKEFSTAALSLLAESAVGTFRLGHEIIQVGKDWIAYVKIYIFSPKGNTTATE